MTWFAATLVVMSLLLRAAPLPSQTPIPVGVWGGKGIRLTVTEKGGAVDYGCDSGSLAERPSTDASGHFVVTGTHGFGEGGPRERGERRPPPRAARYQGTLTGTTMRLTVTLPELGRKLGDFTLELGVRATLDRCG